MDLISFIAWLTTGAVIGWFAKQVATAQNGRRAAKLTPAEDGRSDKS
jgi:hypothetical protein